jgi:hypothetical protein
MKAHERICGAAYPPETLKVMFEAFDDAWTEVGPSMGTASTTVEMARESLADIMLSLAKTQPIESEGLRNAAVAAFRAMYRIR